MKRWQSVLAVAALAAGLAGCGSSAKPPVTTVTATKLTTTTTSGPTTSGPTTPSPDTDTRAACTTSDLAVSVGHGSAAAGTTYYQLKLRNTSSTTCKERGYAGVSLRSSSGRQIGAAAARVSGHEPTVVLAPGRTAYATLGVAEAGNFPSSCGMTPTTGLRIYPPNQTKPQTIVFHAQGCTDTADELLHIKPLTSSPTVAATTLPGVPTGAGNTRLTSRPARIYLGDNTGATLSGDRSRTPMHWQKWTNTDASGSGIEKVNLCRPDCAAGHYGDYPMMVTLSRPKRLDGRRLFTSLDLRYTSKRRPPGTKLTQWIARYQPANGRARAFYWWAPRDLR